MLTAIGLQDRDGDGTLDDESGHAIRSTVLISRAPRPPPQRGAEFMRDQLTKVGMRIDVTAVASTVLAHRWKTGNDDAILGRLDCRTAIPR